jgi:purine-nucleoside phosphorylase
MDMTNAESYAEFIKEKIGDFKPEVAVVLGSGLGDIFNGAEIIADINYSDIPNFPVSTVSGHKGRFIFLRLENKNLVVMQGRVHYYEGYSMQEAVTPICVMKLLGAKTLILTNASGGINPKFNAGDLMIITDQISSFVPSPLIGKNNDSYGERFPDMSNIYNKLLISKIEESAKESNISMQKGVYLQASGPNYESPAEVRMFGLLGADAVGMSTACEAMVANYLGMAVCGISMVSNKAVGLTDTPVTHEEVKRVAAESSSRMGKIIVGLIKKL